jgi:hypothetical protein
VRKREKSWNIAKIFRNKENINKSGAGGKI